MSKKVIQDPWHPDWDGPKELLPLLAAGKLDQVCMNCGRTDPAGGPCSGCGETPGYAYWHPIWRSRAQQRNAVKRGKSLIANRSSGADQ